MYALRPLCFMGGKTCRSRDVIARMAKTLNANGVAAKYPHVANLPRTQKPMYVGCITKPLGLIENPNKSRKKLPAL